MVVIHYTEELLTSTMAVERLPPRLENKACGTFLFLCFRNPILVRISAYGTTQIWLEAAASSFRMLVEWKEAFQRTTDTFVELYQQVKHAFLLHLNRIQKLRETAYQSASFVIVQVDERPDVTLAFPPLGIHKLL